MTVKFPHIYKGIPLTIADVVKKNPGASLIFGKEMWPNMGSHSMHNMSGVYEEMAKQF